MGLGWAVLSLEWVRCVVAAGGGGLVVRAVAGIGEKCR
jgi:hypothetical protein